jgi:hypothetical protein
MNRCEDCLAPKGKKCPFWIGTEHAVFEKNVSTGDQRLVTGCFPIVFMRLMEFVVHTNVSAAAASEAVRNEIDRGFSNVHRVLDIAKDVEMVRMLEGALKPELISHRKNDGE